MATHSTAPACRIPGTGEPGGLPSIGSHRVGHDWSNLAAAAAAAMIAPHYPFPRVIESSMRNATIKTPTSQQCINLCEIEIKFYFP